MQVGPCIPVGVQLEKAEIGSTSGLTRRLSLSISLVLATFQAERYRQSVSGVGGQRARLVCLRLASCQL